MRVMLITLGIVLLVMVCIVACAIGIVQMSTKEGSFVIITENNQQIHARRITFLSNNSISYEKNDGTTGAIFGNFRVETISQILEKLENK